MKKLLKTAGKCYLAAALGFAAVLAAVVLTALLAAYGLVLVLAHGWRNRHVPGDVFRLVTGAILTRRRPGQTVAEATLPVEAAPAVAETATVVPVAAVAAPPRAVVVEPAPTTEGTPAAQHAAATLAAGPPAEAVPVAVLLAPADMSDWTLRMLKAEAQRVRLPGRSKLRGKGDLLAALTAA